MKKLQKFIFTLVIFFLINIALAATGKLSIPSDSSPVKIINSDFQTEQNTTVKDSLEVDLIYGDSDSDIALMGGDVGIGILNPDVALNVSGDIGSTGTIAANAFAGDGSALTNIPQGPKTGFDVFFTFLSNSKVGENPILIGDNQYNSNPDRFNPVDASGYVEIFGPTDFILVENSVGFETVDNGLIEVRVHDNDGTGELAAADVDYNSDETDKWNHLNQNVAWAGSITGSAQISAATVESVGGAINNDNTSKQHAGWMKITAIRA